MVVSAVLAASPSATVSATVSEGASAGKINVVATTAMIAEPLSKILGEDGDVRALIKTGGDPHSYRPTRSDIVALATADAIIWTSDHLEPRFARPIKRLSRHIPTFYIIGEFSEQELISHRGAVDPHLWMDERMWATALAAATEFIADLDDRNRKAYNRRLAAYKLELLELGRRLERMLATIPPPKRVLITSHDAFSYFGRRHRMEVRGLLGVSTESEVSLKRVEDLVDFIANNGIPAVFSESSLPIDHLSALKQGLRARGRKLTVAGPLFSDSLDASDRPAGSYLGMLRANACVIASALEGDAQKEVKCS